ncbi:hypothetical protein IMZ48_49670 [Candidatus Bathyarchaeota archaeon]|nr:hypothetical protein [Candidatus Bathyarchaeota archaeon]
MAATEPMLPVELAPPQHGHPRTSFSVSSTGDDDEHRLSFEEAHKGEKRSGLLHRLGLGRYARRTLGICCLTVTVFLWTLANFLASVRPRYPPNPRVRCEKLTPPRRPCSPTTPTTSPS